MGNSISIDDITTYEKRLQFITHASHSRSGLGIYSVRVEVFKADSRSVSEILVPNAIYLNRNVKRIVYFLAVLA
jgi:hypothetical protein